MKHIAIFASGRGSNASKIIDHFEKTKAAKVVLILSNRSDAPVLDLAQSHQIETVVLKRKIFYESTTLLETLSAHQVDWIVLAGFLWLIPSYLVKAYDHKIVNIHPALLPKYGGKGMYGIHVHEAVHAAQEPETGITIHYVNEQYDEGAVIFQASCALSASDQPNDIARKVQILEHQHFAPVIESLIQADN